MNTSYPKIDGDIAVHLADSLQKIVESFNSLRAELARYQAEEESAEAWWNEPLNLQQAAEWSGYSPAHLGRQLTEGKIPNTGRKNAPKVRRGDLPRKGRLGLTRPLLRLHPCGPRGEQTARSVVSHGGEQ